MKLIIISIFIDLVLTAAIALCEPVRIPMFTGLAVINLVFFLILFLTILQRALKDNPGRGISLEFVMCNTFFVMALGLFRLTDTMIADLCR